MARIPVSKRMKKRVLGKRAWKKFNKEMTQVEVEAVKIRAEYSGFLVQPTREFVVGFRLKNPVEGCPYCGDDLVFFPVRPVNLFGRIEGREVCQNGMCGYAREDTTI